MLEGKKGRLQSNAQEGCKGYSLAFEGELNFFKGCRQHNSWQSKHESLFEEVLHRWDVPGGHPTKPGNARS